MTESGLTTELERAQFAAGLAEWLENRLQTAPLDQLRAVEDALYRYRPAFYAGRKIYGQNGAGHLL